MPLFGSKSPKNPQEVCRALKESLTVVERAEKKGGKAQEDISKSLSQIKTMLYGSSDSEPQTDIATAQLSQEFYNTHLLLTLIINLNKIDFEGKKDVAQIFNNILRRQIGIRTPTVEYLVSKPEVLYTLITGYEQPEVALHCGTMLRECARHEALTRIIINSKLFYNFFKYVEVSTFDIASDAFSTFKELLTKHKVLCAEFLEANYDEVFRNYEHLLNSDNYVTRRQSLKLLGELLLDRHNFSVMKRYISNPDNLKLMMTMLKEKSRNIQFEAFHVFKPCGGSKKRNCGRCCKSSNKQLRNADIAMTRSDMKLAVKNNTFKWWMKRWKNVGDNKLPHIQDAVQPFRNACIQYRHWEIPLARLRIGHTRLTHEFLMQGDHPPFCQDCLLP